jgi:SAM-dependent methyltransferase
MVKKRIQDFDLQNPFWESHWDYSKHPELFHEPSSEAAKQAAEMFKKEGITKILELGGGLGRDTLFFAKNGFQVYVLEYTEAGVQTIKNKANEEGLTENITAIRHDVREPLPFKEGFFEGCYSHMLYCMAISDEELEFLSKEINRVLNSNGLNFYTVRNANDPLYGTGIHKGKDIYEIQGFIIHFFDEEKIKQLTKGYELIEVKEFEEGALPKRLYQVVLRKNNDT